jgi:hypothetical protein
MDKNILYFGVELDPDSRELLKTKFGKQEGWKLYCHHMTCVFNTRGTELTPQEEKWFKENDGKEMILIVTHYGETSKVAAVRVMTSAISRNKYKHITVATKDDGKPVESNYIEDWIPIKPVILVGKVKTWYRKKEKREQIN